MGFLGLKELIRSLKKIALLPALALRLVLCRRGSVAYLCSEMLVCV